MPEAWPGAAAGWSSSSASKQDGEKYGMSRSGMYPRGEW